MLFFLLAGTSIVFGNSDGTAEKTDGIKISGALFAEYAQALNGSKDGHFALNRVRLTVRKNLPGIFSFRVTLDALGLEDPEKEGYEALVKYAYLQAAPKLGPVAVTFQGGMIGTPSTSLVNSLTGIRWIGNTYIGVSKNILADAAGAALSIDTTADLGISLKANISDVVILTGALTNGEGYKNVDTDTLYKGKAYYSTLVFNPLKSIYINGFFRYFQKDAVTDLMYYGGGVAWKGTIFSTGAHVIGVTNDTGSSASGFLIEGWINLNFNTIIGLPVLVIGRAGIAHSLDDTDNGQYGGGLGYKFNKNVQTAVYYEYTRDFEQNNEHLLSWKGEVKI